MVQQKIHNKVYVNNSAEFIRDVELMVANCEQYNGKRSSMSDSRRSYRVKHFYLIDSLFSPREIGQSASSIFQRLLVRMSTEHATLRR